MAVSRQKKGAIAEVFDRLEQAAGFILGQKSDGLFSALVIRLDWLGLGGHEKLNSITVLLINLAGNPCKHKKSRPGEGRLFHCNVEKRFREAGNTLCLESGSLADKMLSDGLGAQELREVFQCSFRYELYADRFQKSGHFFEYPRESVHFACFFGS